MGRIDFGRKYLQLKGPVKLRLDVRSISVTAIFIVAVIALSVFSLTVGTLKLSVSEVFSALFGEMTGFKRTVVIDWRLPRVLAAIVFGAGLAISGSIFQSITRNPLGSPDILGFTSGSYTGALVVMLVIKSMSFTTIATGALIGGFVTAFIIYLFAFCNGTQGFRLIIVGIAISTVLGSVNSMLLLQSQAEVALTAGAWGVGSLNGIDWSHALPAILFICVLLLFAMIMNRPLREMELGKDTAKSHGVHFERTQLLLIIIAVAITASATAVMGPVAFVALAAPQIALRITNTAESLAPSAAVGAFVLLSADVLAQRMIPGMILPVGVLTLSLGGLYLVWLLFHQARSAA
ncbi:FecCD family ABC transporter permease [Ferdinandcohnia quinoae]|uniref:Iron chelate uptake ABC transporter family permease subunit n=1 Tax=Fredinandcohnia quinoae TaxID=2918902 RepID=A0AAW5E3Q1_9BACI|nr:iron chelate uptake ABC transporter family permease subunit [Fredinandcohnia sp. SECRCQ15]MCH1624621.1 iron chelate uptake ABC transporter family permease subunit [Fredinandcohnia sp. SECRCQ15]